MLMLLVLSIPFLFLHWQLGAVGEGLIKPYAIFPWNWMGQLGPEHFPSLNCLSFKHDSLVLRWRVENWKKTHKKTITWTLWEQIFLFFFCYFQSYQISEESFLWYGTQRDLGGYWVMKDAGESFTVDLFCCQVRKS